MSIEMSKCRRGDKLKARNGDTLEYIKRTDDSSDLLYPHLVRNLDTGRGFTVCENGYFWRHAEDEPHDLDVVEIVGCNRV